MSQITACILYVLLIIWFAVSLFDFWIALFRAGKRKGWFRRHD